jgi:hypothetical protein
MPLVKSITPKKIKILGVFYFSFCLFLTAFISPVLAQDNSPYTRYGLGDIVPSNNISSRAMGGITAAYNDFLSINFNNPASYGSFAAYREATSKKMASGRAILDVGINIENRKLTEPNQIEKFTASNALFSHVQVGIPLRSNWGLSFGLRPITRISYKIVNSKRLYDPNSNLPIDSAVTLYEGSGGSYLASMGTGFKFNLSEKQTLAFGINGGYFFGKKDISTRISILNDSLQYNSGNFENLVTYGSLYADIGFQYQANLKKNLYLTIGAYGNWKQKLNARQDITRETFYYDESAGNVRLDSVYDQKDVKGKIVYPSSYSAGFALERFVDFDKKKAGWLIGMDFEQSKWNDYRFYSQVDTAVRNSWTFRLGGQLRPVPGKNYFSNIAYRAGFFIGRDYIFVKEKLPLLGFSLGIGLPIINYSRLSNAQTVLNVAFEFIKRGNNNNLLKENLFRLSFGFSLSDLWFVKRKYE